MSVLWLSILWSYILLLRVRVVRLSVGREVKVLFGLIAVYSGFASSRSFSRVPPRLVRSHCRLNWAAG